MNTPVKFNLTIENENLENYEFIVMNNFDNLKYSLKFPEKELIYKLISSGGNTNEVNLYDYIPDLKNILYEKLKNGRVLRCCENSINIEINHHFEEYLDFYLYINLQIIQIHSE